MTGSALRGTVLTAADPLGQGRVKVQVPQATGTAGIWAAALQRDGSAAPAPGATVWVVHESGDPGLPVYIPTSAWGPWTPVPASWLASPWLPYTAAYRLGPGGGGVFQGEVNSPAVTSATTLANGFTLMALPAALGPAQNPVSCAVVVMPGGASASVASVARVFDGSVLMYGGPWTYSSGVGYVGLSGLRYAT